MERLSLSLPEDLALRIRRAAEEDGSNISAWLSQAAETQLLLRNANRAIASWEAEHGRITDDELTQADLLWRS